MKNFVGNVKKEMSKVRWISKNEMFTDFTFVFGLSVFFILFFGLIDYVMKIIL